MQPYAPRPIRSHGVFLHRGWRLKDYSVLWGSASVDRDDFERGFALVLGDLPSPAIAEGRAGVGFRIAHQGRTGRYAVLAWWDHENELPIRIAVRRGDGPWHPASGSESICVWDLQVFAFERDAYVATVLGAEGGADAYLERRLESA